MIISPRQARDKHRESTTQKEIYAFFAGPAKRELLRESVSHPSVQAPALYLYCAKGDDVAPGADVDGWAAEHEARGNPVMRCVQKRLF